MIKDRWLSWDGCSNVRDLGGLNTRDGHKTRWGAVVRSDHPANLTEAGWSALYAHGVRTIVTLYSHGQNEAVPDKTPRPPDITTVQIAIEDFTDAEFVKRFIDDDFLLSTPLYYQDALHRWPERHAAAIRAVAQAQPGGVVIHCRRGNDRTGIISLLLLTLAGVAPDDIAADYELSPDPERADILASHHTTIRDTICGVLASLDIETYLCEGGLSQADLDAARARLVEST